MTTRRLSPTAACWRAASRSRRISPATSPRLFTVYPRDRRDRLHRHRSDRPADGKDHRPGRDLAWRRSQPPHRSLTPDEIAALEEALTLQQTGKNNGTVIWSYSIADGALDFLGQGQTATESPPSRSMTTRARATADVTITITGANDAPTLAAVTTGRSRTRLRQTPSPI